MEVFLFRINLAQVDKDSQPSYSTLFGGHSLRCIPGCTPSDLQADASVQSLMSALPLLDVVANKGEASRCAGEANQVEFTPPLVTLPTRLCLPHVPHRLPQFQGQTVCGL